jgi:hypothetical protein
MRRLIMALWPRGRRTGSWRVPPRPAGPWSVGAVPALHDPGGVAQYALVT